MTYDFFADESDKIKILEFIFNQTDLQVFDLYSELGQNICKYENIEDITSKFDLKNGANPTLNFNLWSPKHGGQIVFRKVKLDPKYCNGHTFRYATEGWGLIQLYFGGLKNNQLTKSHIGHFNEKGALKWASMGDFKGKVSDWDWKAIQVTSRKLKYHIQHKMGLETA